VEIGVSHSPHLEIGVSHSPHHTPRSNFHLLSISLSQTQKRDTYTCINYIYPLVERSGEAERERESKSTRREGEGERKREHEGGR
jgi:hypothetical protein